MEIAKYEQERKELIELLRQAEQDQSEDGKYAVILLREALIQIDRKFTSLTS